MNYQEFLETSKLELEKRLAAGTTLQIKSITKINGVKLDGLIIQNPSVNIAPTIYLNPYYHRYLAGVSLADIYEDIIQTYESTRPFKDFDISEFKDFEKIKDKIIYRLVNYEENFELLKDVPYIKYLDFAILFYCQLNLTIDHPGSILVHKQLMDIWNIDADRLYQYAKENTPKLLPCAMESIQTILEKIYKRKDLADLEYPFEMYVLTNSLGAYGASTLLYKDLLKDLSADFQKDLLIIPSSVHEIIIIPTNDFSMFEDINLLIHNTNETQLKDEEVLSNHSYYYSRIDDSISY